MNQAEEQINSTEEIKSIDSENLSETVENTDVENEQKSDYKARFEDINDKYLRLYSEFDNFRKRTIKEKSDLIKTAGADIFTVILPVLDDFDRAIKSLETSDDLEALREGQKLIHHKLKNLLHSKGLEELDSIGKEFDSELHEAITSVQVNDESQKGKVIDEIEKGYTLNGKVIRFAKVIVGA